MTSRSVARAFAAAFLLLAGAAPGAHAQESEPRPTPEPAPETNQDQKTLPSSFGEAVGTWDLSLDGSNRRCTLVLSTENGRNGRVVRFPAGCRRAVPALANVAGWLYADGGIRLVDVNVRPMLRFMPRPDKSSLMAKAENGTTYSLVPLQTIGMLPPDPVPNPAPAPADALRSETTATATVPDVANARAIPGSQPVLPAQAMVAKAATPGPSGIAPTPGIYALDRFNDKDVCRIELGGRSAANKADKDGSSARILPGCHDSGISVFDPVSWRFANGHMTLKAKKGHAVNLIASGDGSWRRDPDVGITFVLRKVE